MNTANNPSIPQSGDILSCGIPAPAPMIDERGSKENPNVWKPTGITGPGMCYKALVRQLPRGHEGLRQGLYPSVLLKTHFLKDPETGVRRTVLCRESIPGQSCPICKKTAILYKKILNTSGPTGGKDAAVKRCRNYWPEEAWYTNVLIRTDQNNPAMNGQVKLWKHTPFVEKKLDAPCRANPAAPAAAPTAQPNDIFAQQAAQTQQVQEFFIPYSPRDGRDFFVVPEWNAETNRVDYSKCSFAQQSSPLAPTDNEMHAILDACHDLNTLYADIPEETVAEAAWAEFWAEVNDTRSSMGQTDAIGATNPNQFAGGAMGFIPSTQAPFQMPQSAPQQTFNQGAPVNHVNGADYFGAAAAQPSAPAPAPAADPFAVGGQPAKAAPANDPFAVGGQSAAAFAAPQQQFAAPQQQFAAPAPQPQQQQPVQPAMGALPAADDDIDLPF